MSGLANVNLTPTGGDTRAAQVDNGAPVTQAAFQEFRGQCLDVINHLGVQLAETRRKQEQQEAALTDAKEALAKAEVLLTAQKQEVAHLKASKETSAAHLAGLEQRVAGMEAEVEAKRAEVAGLKQTIDQARVTIQTEQQQNRDLGFKLNGEQTAHAATKKQAALLAEKVRLEKLLGELNTRVLKGKAGTSGTGGLTGLVTGFLVGGPIGAAAGLAIGAGAGFGGAKLVEAKLKQSDLDWIQNRLPQIDQELQALNGK